MIRYDPAMITETEPPAAPACKRLVVPAGIAAVLLACPPPAAALGGGLLAALAGANVAPDFWRRWAHRLLQLSVVGLGAGVDLPAVAKAGMEGILPAFFGIVVVLGAGLWIGRRLGVARHSALLISAGTAICGGSAIAAVAAVLRPRTGETSAALGTVFLLNAVALILFPAVGHVLHLDQVAFGWWAALAIHDTSSVVGAGLAYGPEALALATTVKLARALWIVPVTLVLAHLERRAGSADAPRPVTIPWFILGFVALAALGWLVPSWRPAGEVVGAASRRLLVATLFLIGAGLGPRALREMGWRPLAHGTLLWLLAASGSLAALRVFGLF